MAKSGGRLVSLDIFRGLTVAFMIIVNNPGSWDHVYPPLLHSRWHGCTPTDLVFPFFLFIVGIATFYSLKKYGSELNSSSLLRIFRRTITIFLLGLFLTIFPYFVRDYSTLRIMGVLQRIALAYGIAAFICLAVRQEYHWVVVAFLLLLYWALLYFFGGNDPYSLEDNFVLKVDTAIMGKNHLSKSFGIPFDPLGLLSTIPAVCTVIIGYFVGGIITKGAPDGKIFIKILLLGIASFGLGYLWNMVFPINKPLWTSSYVLYTAGLAMILFSVIYLIADIFKFQVIGLFFTILGMNALFSYFIADILSKMLNYVHIHSGSAMISVSGWFYQKVCVPIAGDTGGSLMYAIILMMIIWGLSLILYRKKIMIRL